MKFQKIIQNYSEYIAKPYDQKLHAGDLLAESAQILLNIQKDSLSLDDKLQRNYLMEKIAHDLLNQAQNMGYTKQYDLDPKVSQYLYLALDLALDFHNHKPSRSLIPFLTKIIYLEKQKQNSERLADLQKILELSKKLEQEYCETLNS